MQHQTVPQTSGVIATIRALLAAGWRNDSVHQMANGDTVRTMLHPSGREITASTGVYDVDTKLTLTGLTLDQVAGAINGAGLAPAEPASDPRRVAYGLITAGVAAGLPLPEGIALNSFGVIEVQVPNNDLAAADAWSAYFDLPKPKLGEVLKGTARDFRVYKSRVSSHPKVPRWMVEVCAYCDADGGEPR